MSAGNKEAISIEGSESSSSSYQDELCCMIEGTRMVASFSRYDIEIIAHYATTVEIESGETLFSEGEKGRQMYLVTKGSIKILKDSGGETKSLFTVQQGHTLGEMSLFDNLPYSASAVAAQDSNLVSISYSNFDQLAQEHPFLGFNILKRIARLMSLRLRHTTGALVDHID